MDLNGLKSIIKEQIERYLNETYGGYSDSSACIAYIPGENSDLTEEEYETIWDSMKDEYAVCFNRIPDGNDGLNAPAGYDISPDENDVNEVIGDINILPEPLKSKLYNEFYQFLNDSDPDFDDNPDDSIW